MNRRTVIALGCWSALALGSTAAHAAAARPAGFPDRPITFVVPYPPGGGIDVTARTLAAQMQRVTGYQFRVEDRPGGGAIIGNTFVARQAAPDGYTVDVLANPTMAIGVVHKGAPFKVSDLVPIAGITFAPTLWLSNPHSKVGAMDFRQIIAYAKAHPGELKVGVIPNGAFDIATRIVEQQTGAKFTIVPFQGGKPSAVALLGSNIDLTTNYYDEDSQYIQAGRMKPLAVADNTPLAQLPKVPTMKDLGIHMASGTWGADRLVAVSSRVPANIRDYLASLVAQTLAQPQTKAAFAKVGIDLIPLTAAQEARRYQASYREVKDYFAKAGH